jgi:hypothetical protein
VIRNTESLIFIYRFHVARHKQFTFKMSFQKYVLIRKKNRHNMVIIFACNFNHNSLCVHGSHVSTLFTKKKKKQQRLLYRSL